MGSAFAEFQEKDKGSITLGELGEGCLEVFDDFGGDDVGIKEVSAVFEAFVFKQKWRLTRFFISQSLFQLSF
jgi:hypothetical protein